MRRARLPCAVDGCPRPGRWGVAGYPGHLCRHHGMAWRESRAWLLVLEQGRAWARVRGALEAPRHG